jgi:predicted RNA-binding Zn-ribbon protein involved in translation (DUF1610 family)
MKRLTQEEAEQKLKELGVNFEPFVYEGVFTKILCYCKNCGEIKTTTFRTVIKTGNNSCRNCYCMNTPKRKIIELLETHGSKYINHFTNKESRYVEYTCSMCGKVIKRRLTYLKEKKEFRCNDCRYAKGNKWLRNKQQDIEDELKVMGFELGEFVYKNHYTKIPHKCPKCGKWKYSTLHQMRHSGCLCSTCGKNERFTQFTIEERLKSLGVIFHQFDFNDVNDIIEIECPKCGKPHKKGIRSIIYKRHYFCDECRMSELERAVYHYLMGKSIKFEHNYRKLDWLKYKNNLELDFYLPDYNIGIECQGQQHFDFCPKFDSTIEEFNSRIERDRIKKKLCEEHNLQLFHINYNDNIEQKLDNIIKIIT